MNWWIILKRSLFLVGPNLTRKLGSTGLSDTYDLINIELSNFVIFQICLRIYYVQEVFFLELVFFEHCYIII